MQREQVEARLDARLEVLLRTRAAMHKAAEGGHDSEVAHVDNHPADTGSELHDEELDETADIFMAEERTRIDEARRALADGSYGICRDCHKPIPPERLMAVPEAVRCIEDQRRFEGFHRQRTQA
jgi:RNA polymerase-binding transcription factor DksA